MLEFLAVVTPGLVLSVTGVVVSIWPPKSPAAKKWTAIILVAVGIFAGWLVWHQQQKTLDEHTAQMADSKRDSDTKRDQLNALIASLQTSIDKISAAANVPVGTSLDDITRAVISSLRIGSLSAGTGNAVGVNGSVSGGVTQNFGVPDKTAHKPSVAGNCSGNDVHGDMKDNCNVYPDKKPRTLDKATKDILLNTYPNNNMGVSIQYIAGPGSDERIDLANQIQRFLYAKGYAAYVSGALMSTESVVGVVVRPLTTPDGTGNVIVGDNK